MPTYTLRRFGKEDAPLTKISNIALENGKIIGEGSFGVVKDVTVGDKNLAVKFLKSKKDSEQINEEGIHKKIQTSEKISDYPHKPVMTLYSHEDNDNEDNPYITKKANLGDLRKYLLNNPECDLPTILDILEKAALALKQIHEAGYIHRDIKPENIFLHKSKKNELKVKLGDLGLSAEENSPYKFGGSPLYMAPECWEIISGVRNTKSVDIYALGVTAATLFEARGYCKLLYNKTRKFNYVPLTLNVADTRIGKAISNLFNDCCNENPDHRIKDIDEFIEKLNNIIEIVKNTDLSTDLSKNIPSNLPELNELEPKPPSNANGQGVRNLIFRFVPEFAEAAKENHNKNPFRKKTPEEKRTPEGKKTHEEKSLKNNNLGIHNP